MSRHPLVPRLEQLEDRALFAVSAVGGFDPNSATWFLRTGAGPGAPDAGQVKGRLQALRQMLGSLN